MTYASATCCRAPIRNAVLFPGAVAPFDVGREKSVALVEDLDNLGSPVIAILAQRDPATDDPGFDDLYPVGCAARVLKALSTAPATTPSSSKAWFAYESWVWCRLPRT